MIWDWMIAIYLFLAGLGAGALTLAVFIGWVEPEAPRLKLIGLGLAPLVVAIGTLLLLLDARAGLMNPVRLFRIVSNPHSVMSWGVVILVAFMVVGFIEFLLMRRKGSTPRWLDIVGLVCALGVASYTGMLLGDASLTFPLWNPVILPILFVVSALSAGFAAVQLIGHLRKAEDVGGVGFVRLSGVVLPLVEIALIVSLLVVTSATQGPSANGAAASVANIIGGAYAPLFWGGLIVIGLAIPFAIDFIRMMKNQRSDGDIAATPPVDPDGGTGVTASISDKAKVAGAVLFAELCVLAGGFILRFLIIYAAAPTATL